MTSNAKSVDDYLSEVPKDRLEALTRIRAMVREKCPDLEESMQYGMPSYSRTGVMHIAFGSQKQNIALYLLKEGVVNQFRGRFPASAIGKGCIRYRNPAKIDFALMDKMLEAHAASPEEPC